MAQINVPSRKQMDGRIGEAWIDVAEDAAGSPHTP
jgi:hypothetical protein